MLKSLLAERTALVIAVMTGVLVYLLVKDFPGAIYLSLGSAYTILQIEYYLIDSNLRRVWGYPPRSLNSILTAHVIFLLLISGGIWCVDVFKESFPDITLKQGERPASLSLLLQITIFFVLAKLEREWLFPRRVKNASENIHIKENR